MSSDAAKAAGAFVGSRRGPEGYYCNGCGGLAVRVTTKEREPLVLDDEPGAVYIYADKPVEPPSDERAASVTVGGVKYTADPNCPRDSGPWFMADERAGSHLCAQCPHPHHPFNACHGRSGDTAHACLCLCSEPRGSAGRSGCNPNE